MEADRGSPQSRYGTGLPITPRWGEKRRSRSLRCLNQSHWTLIDGTSIARIVYRLKWICSCSYGLAGAAHDLRATDAETTDGDRLSLRVSF